jgi:hypothetical protein
MDKKAILEQCIIEGNVIKLPNVKLDRNEYLAIKKDFELFKGVWKSGKTQGFLFPSNPADVIKQLTETKSSNIKKEFQFFATPSDISEQLVGYADIKRKDLILEPSAGQGSIIDAIKHKTSAVVEYCELMDINAKILNEKYPSDRQVGTDFLELNPSYRYDKIIANPPFTKNQDIKHFKHMYSMLKNGGTLVSVLSTSWITGTQKLQLDFKKWLETLDYQRHDLNNADFKESGTKISTCILVVNK